MLVGPLPWKKSGRETWQRVSRSNEEEQEEESKGKRRKGKIYRLEIISDTHKRSASKSLRCLVLNTGHRGPNRFKTKLMGKQSKGESTS